MNREKQIRLIADRFVAWQTPYGWPDPKTCPHVTTELRLTSVNFHSPTFMAIALYKAAEAVDEPAYRKAADGYVGGYFSALRNPPHRGDFYTKTWLEKWAPACPDTPEFHEWAIHVVTWPFIYGMALAAYRYFRKHNPDELGMESKASAVYEWLNWWRWDEGSYYRNGYGSLEHGVLDAGNQDDLLHMGRGLLGYYAVSGRAEVLADARGLAEYYLTEQEVGTYKGCWSSQLGTWSCSPTAIDNFEHFTGIRACDISTTFNSLGGIEYLTELAAVADDAALTGRIAEKCVAAMKWNFDVCQFDDGAVGMSGRDDKWLGATAGAILSYLMVRDAGFLGEKDRANYGEKAGAARDWLLAHVNEEGVAADGYWKVTGRSEPRPPENLSWLLARTLEALTELDRLGG